MGNSIGLCSLRLPHPPSSYRIPPTNHRLRASRPTHALECAHIARAPKWSTQGPMRIAHCLLSTKICQIYHLHLRIQNGLYSPTNGGATIFSNTHIWVWKSDTPKSPLVYHHLLPKKKLCGVNPPIFQPQPEIFLRLHSEGPQSGSPVAPEAEAPAGRRRRHRSTPPNSSGFQWFLDVFGHWNWKVLHWNMGEPKRGYPKIDGL